MKRLHFFSAKKNCFSVWVTLRLAAYTISLTNVSDLKHLSPHRKKKKRKEKKKSRVWPENTMAIYPK